MKITRVETLMANAGLRNYLFVRLHTSTGLLGIGEASLEWQEKTVETLIHEWVADRVIGRDPFDIERVVGNLIRDQYQGGATVMTAISGVEIAMWDLVGKACGQPLYRLLGGKVHDRIATYANGWYGGATTPQDFAERARDVVRRGYRAMKFDPFRSAWMELSRDDEEFAVACVAAVREAVGPDVDLILEVHGRLSQSSAIRVIRRLEPFRLWWCEEPVNPEKLEGCAAVRQQVRTPISCGERLYALADFQRLFALGGCDVVQPDIAHCGGLHVAKKIAALAAVRDVTVAPHVSIGPVALAAALHFDVSTPNFLVQESFAEFDVPWRNDLIDGWDPVRHGELMLGDRPGLGLDLNDAAIADHPYVRNPFPSLWDADWQTHLTQNDRSHETR